MGELVSLLAGGPDGRSMQLSLELSDQMPTTLRMKVADSVWQEFQASNWFNCLLEARLTLEAGGFFLCCQGARPDVFPSGMLQQMNLGRFAYHLQPDVPLSEDDVVDIFAPADISEVASVEDQRIAVLKFFKISK
ncbi:hypothetical protein BX285_3570 [Streptomyces sp. 1114.5]|uniref:hypothetical protein n=1 Tax=Streptomyces sp. 1114.5 TaxID=1938830 RepID=UPI000EB4EDD2|nr:hypothetical protein [Streptomyces sp. 1114.5]RKT19118.1 hypothetical protein BX285_3570 [Streptomyces sp. 1114.5]